MTGWLYILQLSNDQFYIRSTTDFSKRIKQHKEGKSTYTSKFLPVKLLFKQKYPSYREARRIELKLKQMKNKRIIENIVKNQELTVSVV